MNRKHIVFICFVIIIMLSVSEYGYADTISWVMEKWVMSSDYYPLNVNTELEECKLDISKKVIKSYDSATGEITEYEIPINWIPIRSGSNSDGLFFCVVYPQLSGKRIDVFRWLECDNIQKCNSFYIDNICDSYDGYVSDPYMYYDNKLYIKSYNPFPGVYDKLYITRYGESIYGEVKNVRWGFDNGSEYITSDGNIIGLYAYRGNDYELCISKNTIEIDKIDLSLLSNFQFDMLPQKEYVLTQYEESLLFFAPLDSITLPSMQMYLKAEEQFGVENAYYLYHIPLFQSKQLMQIDINDATICDFKDSKNEVIRINNKKVVSDILVSDENYLFFVAKDFYWGIDEFDEFEERKNGRTMLVKMDLCSGQSEIVYETGYEEPDYSLFTSYWALMNIDGIIGKEYYNDTKKYIINEIEAPEIPLSQNKNGIMEFFPSRFSLYIH